MKLPVTSHAWRIHIKNRLPTAAARGTADLARRTSRQAIQRTGEQACKQKPPRDKAPCLPRWRPARLRALPETFSKEVGAKQANNMIACVQNRSGLGLQPIPMIRHGAGQAWRGCRLNVRRRIPAQSPVGMVFAVSKSERVSPPFRLPCFRDCPGRGHGKTIRLPAGGVRGVVRINGEPRFPRPPRERRIFSGGANLLPEKTDCKEVDCRVGDWRPSWTAFRPSTGIYN